MFSAQQHPRRPRPPGARRPSAQLRAAAAAAGGLSASTLLNLSQKALPSPTSPIKALRRTPSSAPKDKGAAPPPSPSAAPDEPRDPQPDAAAPEDASFASSPGVARSRVLSISSEGFHNSASPPPPYRQDLGLSPVMVDEKLPAIPPPPPLALDSGPSTARTSMTEAIYPQETSDDDHTAANTLTLQGLRRLLRDHECDEEISEVSARLVPYETASRNVLSLKSVPPSPAASSPTAYRASTFQSRAHRSDSGSPLSLVQPRLRVATAQRGYDRHLAFLHAQEEDERIAALEAALADARDSEEAQRKANARLKRHNSQLRRQLEHAEDVVAEHMEQDALRSSTSSARSSPHASHRGRSLRSVPSHDERVGWGAISFPEFPQDMDPNWRINLNLPEVDNTDLPHDESPSSSHNITPQPPSGAVLELPPAVPSVEAEPELASPKAPIASPTESTKSSDHSAVITADGGHTRASSCSPMLVSPGKSGRDSGSGADTPTSNVGFPSQPGSARGSTRSRLSPYPSPHASSPRHQRSESASSNGTGPHRRIPSFGSAVSMRAYLSSATKETVTPRTASPDASAPYSSVAALASRMDSVYSYVSDYLGRRTLGSELGSNYSPSPLGFPTPGKCRCPADDADDDCSYDDDGNGVEVTLDDSARLPGLKCRSRLMALGKPIELQRPEPTPPTAMFVLRGSMSRGDQCDAYEQLYEANVGHIRFASQTMKPVATWAPEVWSPCPSPSPRVAPLPLLASDSEECDQRPLLPLVTASGEGEPGVVDSQLVSFAGCSTPMSRLTRPTMGPRTPESHLLAPGGDPWDEYSDRATPSPRSRALRPLLLTSKMALHSRSSSQVYVHRRTASVASGVPTGVPRFASGNGVPHPAIMTQKRNAQFASQAHTQAAQSHVPAAAAAVLPRVAAGPVTIPGRIMHDVFCLCLIVLDYIEWGIILGYRLLVDIRAGPDATTSRRRTHARRYYV